MSDLSYELDKIVEVHEEICALLYSVASYQDWKPKPKDWSFRLIGAHLAKVEQESYLAQIDTMIAGGKRTFSQYWNTEDELGRPELTDSIIRWKESRRKLVERYKMLGGRIHQISVAHDVSGRVNPQQLLETVRNHDDDHLRHLKKILKQFELE
ncbi:MAG: DinB family protein [Chloroflexota bacterium]